MAMVATSSPLEALGAATAMALPAADLTGISFHDPLWLSAYPLDRNLVFDYFALSPFYDRSCNNEQLRMRSTHPLDMPQLSKMTGIEYVLHEAQEPNLFIFRKQKRESPDKVTALAAYYILDGVVYQAPLMYNVVCSRVVRALHHISNAFSEVAAKLEKIGYDAENEDDTKPDEPRKAADKFVDVKEVIRIDQILGSVLRKLPPAPPPPPMPPPPCGVPEQPPENVQAQASQQDATQKQAATDQGPPLKKPKIEKR